ncbi:glycerol-3-phosphate ABC transporter ATP-binding protein [Jeotgalibacillus malaysiensis]|uniref:Glycerol-3-phosphate ABC transporter ATP-binding protein n=1 Tax=Jeotgalibacillus malaysiensis TaxID=1508404 RepID=A0A0B5AY22_9BACL|nr:sn-glycerol-3-phosphate ABC transporter ATP-binding protein UgpC [Jeotgalibacillus malaysiensis]AJD92884.1 glycerol-3-phosphate ABC transporter ATP-binding protein [Jeotgalibacillus malaysiensis]
MRKVELKGITKSYDGKHDVLKAIDVMIEPGEFFVLVGPSGCGKSTMLRMIAGLESITSGELALDGKRANALSPSERDLSMVFQNYALYPHLTVEQNITFGLHVKKVSKREQKERCKEVCEMLGLSDYMKRKPRELSGGQRQRVALARAVVTQAPLCLMDEPLSNLDAKLRAKMRSEIRQLQRKLGLTMIYVTHDQTEAMTMADRMMILSDGDVQQIGRPLDVYNNPANTFVASFIGSPPMNLIDAEMKDSVLVADGHWMTPVTADMKQKIGSGRVTLGVRPEHIALAKDTEPGFLVQVANVEVLGTETLVTFDFGEETQWIAKWPGQSGVQPGEQIRICVDDRHLALFSAETGERIVCEPVPAKKVSL